MKVLVINDTHFGVRGDSLIFMEYFTKFYEEIFFPYLDAHPEITTILHLGDLFDRRKYINFNTLSKTREAFIDRIIERGLTCHILLGNHDIYYKNTNHVNSLRELLQSDNFIVYEKPQEVILGDKYPVFFVPWIGTENGLADFYSARAQTTAPLAVGHLELTGFKMNKTSRKSEHGQSMKDYSQFASVLSGHFHHESVQDNIHYLGSPYEMTFSDFNDSKGFFVLDLETLDIEKIRNPNRMFHIIRYNDSGKELKDLIQGIEKYEKTYVKVLIIKKENSWLFEQFLEELYQVNPVDVSIIEEFYYQESEEDEEIDVQEDTLSILDSYVDDMQFAEEEQAAVKDILRELYVEATTVEYSDE